MTETQFMDVPNFALQRGGMLPLARLAYRTLGKLNERKDNAVLIPSWITGNDTESEAVMCGPDRALNPDKLFIILTNHLGAGRSSSPSNTPAPCEQARFPTVTYYDNIALQQKLVTERLGLSKLKLVTGISMGGAQTYQWAAQFPEMVEAAVPITGSARAAAFNRVFLYSLKRALMLDPAFENGFYTRAPVDGLKAFATKARVVSITVDHDRYFPPVDADYAASKITNGESRVVQSIWGHMAPFNPDDAPAFDAILASVLNA